MAIYYSAEQTIYNNLVPGASSPSATQQENLPGKWAKGQYISTYDNTTGTVGTSSTLQFCTLFSSCIVIAVSFLWSVSLSTANVAFGTTTTANKYAVAAATYTTAVNQWVSLMVGATLLTQAGGTLEAAGAIIQLTNDTTAAMPATGMEALWVETAEPW